MIADLELLSSLAHDDDHQTNNSLCGFFIRGVGKRTALHANSNCGM